MATAISSTSLLAAQLTPFEIDQATVHLEQVFQSLVGAVKGVSEEQASYRPASGAWSIAENVTHIAMVQERVLSMVREHLPSAPPPPEGRNVELVDAIVINYFTNRLSKFNAPEFIQPCELSPLPDALKRVEANNRQLLESLTSVPGLRQHAVEFPPLKAVTKGEHVFADGYQWILAASSHTERHVKQILEVKAAPGFPV